MTEATAEAPEIVFLHTASVHVQTFDRLLRELRPETRARHVVREDLLADALQTVKDCNVIVLAQASMAGAADLCSQLKVAVLSSPRLGLESALAAMDANAARRRTR